MWRHKNRTKAKILLVALCSSQMLSGCSLLPEEKTRPTLVVQNSEKIDYQVETVKREDIIKSKFIYCTYVQLSDESLSFGLDGRAITSVHTYLGQTVKKGELLAELDLGTDAEKMKLLEYDIEKLKIELSAAKNMKQLEKERENEFLKAKIKEKQDYDKVISEIEKKYRDEINYLEDTLYIKELEMERFLELEKSSKIYAGMDGIVSFVKDNLIASTSKKDELVVRIIDNSHCAFRVETEYAPYFVEGEIIPIEMRLDGGAIHEARVSHDPDNKDVVYFELLEPNFSLSVGDRGTINLILEEKKDAVTVSNKAVRKAENFNYVYYINEDGIRSMKEVTIGISGNNTIEITSGLSVGDIVITR